VECQSEQKQCQGSRNDQCMGAHVLPYLGNFCLSLERLHILGAGGLGGP
jgi:hypothetical protein